MNMSKKELELKEKLRIFAEERDWNQFHSPKNLAMALIVEAAEIVEKFQWMSEEDSAKLDEEKRNEVKEEIGDIFIYLVRLADMLDISPFDAAFDKLEKNRKKYPIHKSKGNSKKYTEF